MLFRSSYLVDSYDAEKSKNRILAFMDTVLVDGKRTNIFVPDTLSYILNVISEI